MGADRKEARTSKALGVVAEVLAHLLELLVIELELGMLLVEADIDSLLGLAHLLLHLLGGSVGHRRKTLETELGLARHLLLFLSLQEMKETTLLWCGRGW